MIPRAYVQAWSTTTPWPDPRQVEQDLIICRALCDIFNEPFLAERLAFRGGTAINKLLFRQPLRYSEDIDLVNPLAPRSTPFVELCPGSGSAVAGPRPIRSIWSSRLHQRPIQRQPSN